MKQLIDLFFDIPPGLAVAAVFLVPALETAVVLGFVLPGELTVVLGGVLAGHGRVPLSWILAASVTGPLVGDVSGFLLGRRYGMAIVRHRLRSSWPRARRRLSQKGGVQIFFGRFVPFLRTVLPVTAGALAMPARRFLPWDLAAALVWGVGSALIGYFAGREWERVLSRTGHVSLALLALVLITVTLWIARRKPLRRARSRRSAR